MLFCFIINLSILQRLGCFNLSLRGHADCVDHVLSYNVPTLVLGGGGYTMRNVARCWAFETSVILNQEVSNKLPSNAYYEYYGPDYKLHITPSNMENNNSQKYLETMKLKLFEILHSLEAVPGVFDTSLYKTQIPDTGFEEKGISIFLSNLRIIFDHEFLDEDKMDVDINTEAKETLVNIVIDFKSQ